MEHSVAVLKHCKREANVKALAASCCPNQSLNRRSTQASNVMRYLGTLRYVCGWRKAKVMEDVVIVVNSVNSSEWRLRIGLAKVPLSEPTRKFRGCLLYESTHIILATLFPIPFFTLFTSSVLLYQVAATPRPPPCPVGSVSRVVGWVNKRLSLWNCT